MRVTRRAFAIGTGAATTAAGISGVLAQTPFTPTVTIGVVAPLSGPARRAGEQLNDGVRAAIDEANRLRTSFERAYALRSFDDQNDVATAMVNSEFAISDPSIVGVIGHLGGVPTDKSEPNYWNARLPLIVPATTFDDITSHGYRNVFRLPTKDQLEGDLFAQFVTNTQKVANVHILVQDGDYGPELARAFSDRINASKVPGKVTSFPWEKPDFRAVAHAVVATSPAYVFLAGTATDMGGILPELRAAGYTGPIGASQAFFDPLTLAQYAKDAEGMVVSTSMPPLALAPGAFRILNDFQTRYGPMTPVAAFGYASAQILLSAIRRSGASTRNALLSALLVPGPYDTLVGTFQFSPSGDPNDPNVYFYTARDGKWTYLRAAHPTSFLIK